MKNFEAGQRRKLPNRRPAETVVLVHEGQSVFATLGFCPETGAVREVFLRRGGPPGSDMDRLLDDVGVLMSRLLQLGEDPAVLAKSLGRLGWYPNATGSVLRDPAQTFVDYLTNDDHGLCLDASAIDRDALYAAAKVCDEAVQGPTPAASIVGVVADWLARVKDEAAGDADDLDDFNPGGTD